MNRSSTAAVQRLAYRVAAFLVVSVFASLPTLVRIHDRLTPVDHIGSFRLSKNIERPRESHSTAPLIRVTTRLLDVDRSFEANLAEIAPRLRKPIAVGPVPVRAPPVL